MLYAIAMGQIISVLLWLLSPAERGDSRQPLIRTIVRVADDVKHSACVHVSSDTDELPHSLRLDSRTALEG